MKQKHIEIMIEADIVKAQKAIKIKGIIETVGKVCETSGALTKPFTSFSSLRVSFCGSYICWLANSFFDLIKRHLRASFGIYHK